jgi:signal transduction histidine kinase
METTSESIPMVEGRSPLLLLQTLVMIILSYQLVFTSDRTLSLVAKTFIILCLMGSTLILGRLPTRFQQSGWFIGTLVLTDTILTAYTIHLSAALDSDLFIIFFLIILLAGFSPNLKQMLGLSVLLCAIYGVTVYIRADAFSEGRFLRIPLLLIMATFYGATAETIRKQQARQVQLIKESKQAEVEKSELAAQLRQAHKMEAIGLLAGGVAHDFNNVLTVILGNASVVLHTMPARAPDRSSLEEIKRAGERGAILTRQLLAFSRTQALKPSILNLGEVFMETRKMLHRLIEEDIELVHIQEDIHGLVKADRGQLEQVILNLAVNARDAMPQGGKLTTETRNCELDERFAARHLDVHPGPYVMMAMTDTGCGMDKSTCGRIFEPFFTTKSPGKGTGLGLSTVYGIVKQSGGFITVDSEIGKGTSFKIYLPRVPEGIRTAAPAPKVTPITPECQRSETILLVEDEESVRSLVRKVMGAQGFQVLQASNGREALSVSQEHRGPIHLLLTDVVMPEMDGPHLAEQLLAVHPETVVLYMSGHTDHAILHSRIVEAAAFLQKPFTAEALNEKVSEVLST